MSVLRDPVKRGYVAMALLALVALSVLGPLVLDRDARHLTAYRSGDEDVSLVRAAIEGKAARIDAVISTPHILDEADPARTVFVAIGAERRYDDDEARAIVDFLRAGGNVLLADEGGFGTDIARAAGFAFGSQRVLDTRNHLGDPKLVVSTSRLDGQDYPLLFNAPTLIIPLEEGMAYETLATSSSARYPDGSYLDANENGEIDISDNAGPFPLVVRRALPEGGTIVLVADTGLFMNAQGALIDYRNLDFVAALVQGLVPSDGVIVLDEGRHAPTPAVAPWNAAARTLGRLTNGPVAPYATLAVLLALTGFAWYLTRKTEDWTHHEFNVGVENPVPEDLRPDLGRAQRMARRRISERFNIPMEQVAGMPTEQLATLTGDRLLAEAAAGTLKGDPAPVFRSFSSSSPEAPQ